VPLLHYLNADVYSLAESGFHVISSHFFTETKNGLHCFVEITGLCIVQPGINF